MPEWGPASPGKLTLLNTFSKYFEQIVHIESGARVFFRFCIIALPTKQGTVISTPPRTADAAPPPRPTRQMWIIICSAMDGPLAGYNLYSHIHMFAQSPT